MGDCEAGTGYQQSPWLDAEGCPDLLQLCIGTFSHDRTSRIEAFVENDRPSNVLDIPVWRASRHEERTAIPLQGPVLRNNDGVGDPVADCGRDVPSVIDADAKAARGENGMLKPEAIAEAYWQLHQQHPSAWSFEIDLRPFKETF